MPRQRSPVVDRRILSAALRSLREESGLSLSEAAGKALDASAARLSRIETGKQVAGPRDVRDLCALYRADEARTQHLISLAVSARESGWWEREGLQQDDYVGLEAGAVAVHQFENAVVPGLLQTDEYAEAYVRESVNPTRSKRWTESQVQQVMRVRRTRQAKLLDEPGTELHFVLDETVLLRPVGGGEAMRRQLRQLLTSMENPRVHLRAVPLAGGASPGQSGGFTVLTLPDASDIAYIETLAGSILLDSATEVSRLRRLFSALADGADERGTQRLLRRRLKEL